MFMNRETKITWLNWLPMYNDAEKSEDEDFFLLPASIWKRIEEKCGEDSLIEWAEDQCEDCGFNPTVSYHIRNTDWSWKEMMEDMQTVSAEFPEIIFQITFIEGEYSTKSYLHAGCLTAVLYNEDSGSFVLAF